MAEQAGQKEESQQPDSGRTTTQVEGPTQTRLGHQDHYRSGRQTVHSTGAGLVSDKEQYTMVEKYRLDTWAFIMFFAICGAVSYL